MAQDCSDRKFLGRLWCNVFLQGDPEARQQRRDDRQERRDERKDARQERRDESSGGGWASGLFGNIWEDDYYVNSYLNLPNEEQEPEPAFNYQHLMNQQDSNRSGISSPMLIGGGLLLLLMVMMVVLKR